MAISRDQAGDRRALRARDDHTLNVSKGETEALQLNYIHQKKVKDL